MSTLTQLEYLVAVAAEGHFGRAARSCHVSQPSLSAQIKKLEEELGVALFDRATKPIVATQAGQEIIEQAKTILKEHRKLQAIADLGSGAPKGEFRLAVIPTLAPQLIPRFIGHFSRSYPEVRLNIDEQKTENIVELLLHDALDAGLLVTPLDEPRLATRHLFFEPFYCYVNEFHPLARKRFIAEPDLERDQLWLLAEGHCFRQQVLNVCAAGQDSGVLPNVGFGSGSLDTLRKLVQVNSGYTLLPQLAVMDLPEAEQGIHVRRFRKPVPTREVSLVHGRGGLVKRSIIQALETSILSQLPRSIRSLKRRDLEVVDIYE